MAEEALGPIDGVDGDGSVGVVRVVSIAPVVL
jgi:hypothetical protein